MEMKLDSKLIKSEREKRAWSQQHLARVSGLGIRTIQRIENTGSASLESVKALASVFDMDIEKLQGHSHTGPQILRSRSAKSKRIGLATLIAVLIAIAGFISTRTSLAAEIQLTYSASLEDQNGRNEDLAVNIGNVILATGNIFSIQIEHLKLEVIPTVYAERGEVMLAVKVFEKVDGEYLLRAEPKVSTLHNEEAVVRSDTSTGYKLSVILTPNIL